VKIVEPEVLGPPEVEEAPPHPTPPRPEHRRVYVSFLFTLAVLVGTVVTVYTVFPARHNVVVTAAVSEHRRSDATWQLPAPRPEQLASWSLGVLGGEAPLPAGDVVGARAIDIVNRHAAVIGYKVGGAEVTLLVQRARDMPPRRVSKDDGDDHVEAWRVQKWTFVAVGPAASAATWKAALGVPRE
jgi:hypothetical protein